MTFKVSYHHSIFTFWLLDKQKKENVLIHNCDVDLKGLDLHQPYVQQGRDLIMSNKSYMLEKKFQLLLLVLRIFLFGICCFFLKTKKPVSLKP